MKQAGALGKANFGLARPRLQVDIGRQNIFEVLFPCGDLLHYTIHLCYEGPKKGGCTEEKSNTEHLDRHKTPACEQQEKSRTAQAVDWN